MNEVMLAQPSTQRNLAQLQADGFSIVGPASGWQACRAVGSGRMTEPMELLEIIEARLGR
jgi:phosphopantothenoylcysteine decarboxylase / phosphopantothenate---cysteine ligase